MIVETIRSSRKKEKINRSITGVSVPIEAAISTVPSLEDEWYKVTVRYDSINGEHLSTARFTSLGAARAWARQALTVSKRGT